MSYQVIWYCLGMREILNVPFDSVKYVTFSIPVILIRRLLSTGPLQNNPVISDIFSKTNNWNDCLCQNHHFRWLDLHENRQKKLDIIINYPQSTSKTSRQNLCLLKSELFKPTPFEDISKAQKEGKYFAKHFCRSKQLFGKPRHKQLHLATST